MRINATISGILGIGQLNFSVSAFFLLVLILLSPLLTVQLLLLNFWVQYSAEVNKPLGHWASLQLPRGELICEKTPTRLRVGPIRVRDPWCSDVNGSVADCEELQRLW